VWSTCPYLLQTSHLTPLNHIPTPTPVAFLVLPYEKSHWEPFFLSILPCDLFSSCGYDPLQDRTANLMMISAILGYAVMSGLCSLLDLVSPKQWKCQGSRSYMGMKTWCRVVGVSLSNMFVSSWVVLLPIWYLHKSGILRSGTPLASFGDSLNISSCLMNFGIHSIVIEIWFYSTHKLLHWGPLYKSIHKLHHTFKAPTAVACMYAHPVEFCLGNVAGVILGPALTNAHPYECMFWMCFSLASTSGSHSGYPVFGASDHDAHHEHLYCNYGTGVFMDKMLGTEYEGSELQAAVRTRTGARKLQ